MKRGQTGDLAKVISLIPDEITELFDLKHIGSFEALLY